MSYLIYSFNKCKYSSRHQGTPKSLTWTYTVVRKMGNMPME